MMIRATQAIKHKGRWYGTGEVFDADGPWGEYLIRHGAAEAATEAPGNPARDEYAADPGPLDAEVQDANQVGEGSGKRRKSSRKRK